MVDEGTNQLKSLLKYLIAAYPCMKIMPETITIYASVLSDLPIEALKRAIHYHISSNKFFPTIAELREAVDITDQQIRDKAQQRLQQMITDCQMCDQNGFRFIRRNGIDGVKRCTHDRQLEQSEISTLPEYNFNQFITEGNPFDPNTSYEM